MQLVHEERRVFGSLNVEENLVLAGLTAKNKWSLDRIYGMFPRLKERRGCRELAAAGQTILLVEQNLAATLALSDRVYIVNNGHIVHEGPAAELKAQPEILQRYLGV